MEGTHNDLRNQLSLQNDANMKINLHLFRNRGRFLITKISLPRTRSFALKTPFSKLVILAPLLASNVELFFRRVPRINSLILPLSRALFSNSVSSRDWGVRRREMWLWLTFVKVYDYFPQTSAALSKGAFATLVGSWRIIKAMIKLQLHPLPFHLPALAPGFIQSDFHIWTCTCPFTLWE